MMRAALAFALLAGVAIAAGPVQAMEPYLPKTAKSFGKADADANGKVTAAEIVPLAEKRFQRIDRDRNGAVTAAEIDEALKRALERRRDRIMARLDADRNGAVSRTELDRYVAGMVAAADGDHDGGVSLEEARNYRVAKLKKPATGDKSN
jgi:Ca2+-binding EF-hand superfamily protein